MKLLVITRPDFFCGEAAIVRRLFDAGLQRLHLRKPTATREQLAEWIEKVPPLLRHRIVLHDHYDLVQIYALGGIHMNRRNPNVPDWFDPSRFTLSRSCHTIAELELYKHTHDYLTLSPIFDSISKEGYGAAFSREELAEAKDRGLLYNNVYALGGITFSRLAEVHCLGFDCAALLGEVWNAPETASF